MDKQFELARSLIQRQGLPIMYNDRSRTVHTACRAKLAEVVKDEHIFKIHQQQASIQGTQFHLQQALAKPQPSMRRATGKSFRFGATTGGGGSFPSWDFLDNHEPEPEIKARLKSALSADLEGNHSIKASGLNDVIR